MCAIYSDSDLMMEFGLQPPTPLSFAQSLHKEMIILMMATNLLSSHVSEGSQ